MKKRILVLMWCCCFAPITTTFRAAQNRLIANADKWLKQLAERNLQRINICYDTVIE